MSRPVVILVHGLWMTGAELFMLRKRLRTDGFQVHQFQYRMVSQSLEHNISALEKFIRRHADGNVGIIGHSLGGVLALQTLRACSGLPVNRVVCLGSPLTGTVAGSRFMANPIGRTMLGKTLPEAIFAEPIVQWEGPETVGVIAGSRSFGLGKLIMRLPRPNDGVVTVAETCLPGISDHLVLPVTHVGLVLSRQAGDQCTWFLRHGQFQH